MQPHQSPLFAILAGIRHSQIKRISQELDLAFDGFGE
jgi:hypothetical protein